MTPTQFAAYHARQADDLHRSIRGLAKRGYRCRDYEREMRFHVKAALKVIELAGHAPRRHEARGLLLVCEGRGW